MDWSRRFLSILVALCLCFPTYSQLEIKTGVRTRVDAAGFTTIGDRIYLESGASFGGTEVGLVKITTDAANVEVEVSDVNRIPYSAKKVTKEYYEIDKPGKWFIDVTAIDFAKSLYGRKSAVLEIGVGPGPGPTPEPGPTPRPDVPAPIEGLGLRVLIVYESSEATKLTTEQQQMLFGAKVRDYLNQNCVKGPDGTPEWRLLDADTQYSDQGNKWAKALARPRTSLPWLIVSNGVTGSEGPLPSAIEEMVLTVDQFIGTKSSTSGNTSVTMLTIPNCGYCEKFKREEKPKLKVAFLEASGVAKMYPTFVIEHAGKQSRMEGWRTAEHIHQEIKRLGGLQ